MQKRYIHTYVGVGEHGYKWLSVEGAYDGYKAAIQRLIETHGEEWVDENYENLVLGASEGTIAWFTDVLGYSITNSMEK